ncbi:MAG: hypothetical protein N2201_06265, partial [candidate division WOR-3 bacterium]|nr:hypothetical protein [candidate division WOR-3 bacterium]
MTKRKSHIDKKYLGLIILGSLLIGNLNADTTFFVQNFNGNWSTTSPPSGWTIINQPTYSQSWQRDSAGLHWSNNHSGYAELAYDKGLRQNEVDSLISPIIDCSRYRNVILRCSTYFRHNQGNYIAKIVGSTDGGATYPYVIKNYYFTYHNFPQTETFLLNWAQEKDSIRIAWVFTGNIINIHFWCLDNVSLTGRYVYDKDVACLNILRPYVIQPPGFCTLMVNIANVGKEDLNSVKVRCSIIDWANNFLHLADTTISSLNYQETLSVKLYPPYNFQTPTFYWAKAYCEVVADENYLNDTASLNFSVSWSQTLRYCEDEPLGRDSFPVGEQGWGVKFTPDNYPAQIDNVEFYLGNPSGTARFKVRIVDDDGPYGAPGTTIYETPFCKAEGDSQPWNTILLFEENIFIREGSFYVFYIQVDDQPFNTFLYHDGLRDYDEIYYEYQDSTYEQDFPQGDWLIHTRLIYRPYLIEANDVRTVFVKEPRDEFVRRPFIYAHPITARIENVGINNQSNFIVSCTTRSYYGNLIRYYDTETIPYLASGQGTFVRFSRACTVRFNDPVYVVVTTHLSADLNRSNDKKEKFVSLTLGKFTGHETPTKYAWFDSDSIGGPEFSWIDTNGAYLLTDFGDDTTYQIPHLIPFAFPFYDSTYRQVYVSTNGYITFYPEQTSSSENLPAPSGQTPNCAIYVFWDDLLLPSDRTGKIFYHLYSGQSPNRKFVITWYNVARKNSPDRLSFQIILCEDGKIICQYRDVFCGNQWANFGKSATVGIENQNGTKGLTYLFGSETSIINWPENRLEARRAIRFYKEFRDIGVKTILAPKDSIVPGTITPMAIVRNYGTEMEDSVLIYLKIMRNNDTVIVYYDSCFIPAIFPEQERYAVFSDWDAHLGIYTVTCSTNMMDDFNHKNNVSRSSVSVLTWILKAPIPVGPANKKVKNGALAYAPPYNKIYALKGGACDEFWCYDIATNSWESLPRMPKTPSGKKPKAGCALTYGNAKIFAFKGGNTDDFYSYDIMNRTWQVLKPVSSNFTLSKPKDGAGLTFSEDYGLVYAIIGNNTNVLLAYNPNQDTWYDVAQLQFPYTYDGKPFRDGASINYYAGVIYIIKGNQSNEISRYNISQYNWIEPCTIPNRIKIRSGATSTCQSATGIIYFFIGGTKSNFLAYNIGANSFDSLTPIPLGYNRKKVKKGSALVATPAHLIYAFKSGNTNEFWAYAYWAETKDDVKADKKTYIQTEPSFQSTVVNSTHSSTIAYVLTEKAEVELNVYSITGQLVKKLYRQEQLPGTYQIHWNGKNSRGQNLRGIYFIKGRIGVHPIT